MYIAIGSRADKKINVLHKTKIDIIYNKLDVGIDSLIAAVCFHLTGIMLYC